MLYRFKEKTVHAFRVGSNHKLPPDWDVSFTLGDFGSLDFIVKGRKELFNVPDGVWFVQDTITGKVFRVEDELFSWLSEKVELN